MAMDSVIIQLVLSLLLLYVSASCGKYRELCSSILGKYYVVSE